MSLCFLLTCLSFCLAGLSASLVLFVRQRTLAAARLRASARIRRGLLSPSQAALRVLFLHPDLGIGGAERLVVDAAVALQRHQRVAPVAVVVATNHHDARRAFGETVDGSVDVRVFGAWLPPNVCGRAKVLCATLRMAWAAAVGLYRMPDVDCVVVDQIAAALPVLSLLAPNTPRLFYCHFPDQCCDPNRDAEGKLVRPASGLRSAHAVYRRWFDALEEWSMGFADSIVSNSKFSRDVTVRTFPKLATVIDPEKDIFYPPVTLPDCHDVASDKENGAGADNGTRNNDICNAETNALLKRLEGRTVVLSINRYERKKNLSLAIEATAATAATAAPLPKGPLLLVMAGGYDERLAENVEYLRELQSLAARMGLREDDIIFLKNISDEVKVSLLSRCCCLLYTPTMEHFGIVPTEAMMRARPVVAVNSGGPCESVGDGGTLCDPTPEAFASALMAYAADEALAQRTGEAGRRRAKEVFSIEVFGEKLATRIISLCDNANAKLDAMCGSQGREKRAETERKVK